MLSRYELTQLNTLAGRIGLLTRKKTRSLAEDRQLGDSYRAVWRLYRDMWRAHDICAKTPIDRNLAKLTKLAQNC